MSLLGLALKAGVPLIRVYTSDLVNLPEVLHHITGEEPVQWNGSRMPHHLGGVHYTVEDVPVNVDLYEKLVERNGTLVLVNYGEESSLPFNAGEVPVPKKMVEKLLREVVPKDQTDALVSCFSGLTLKTISEVVRLVMAQDKSLTPKGVLAVRSMLAGKMQGLVQVEAKLPLYLPPQQLTKWVAQNKTFFLECPDPRLVPRGIMLAGEPGTGKTTAAKYIAKQFDVPLYRLDLSAALSKWVGESEINLSRILSTIDQEAPAVLLIDEVEKLFAVHEDSGVTARLLSQMLWWGAEHTSRVLTVMTTNDFKALPKELYREGRVDRVLTISPLESNAAMELAYAVAHQFVSSDKMTISATGKLEGVILKMGNQVAHAKVVQTVYDLIKGGLLGKLHF